MILFILEPQSNWSLLMLSDDKSYEISSVVVILRMKKDILIYLLGSSSNCITQSILSAVFTIW